MLTGKCLLGSVLAVGLSLAVMGVTSSAGQKDDAAFYTVVIKTVEVKATQKNGDHWDVNEGKPDVRVIVRNLSNKDAPTFSSKEKTDTFAATFDEPTTMKFRAGDILEFEVVDVDVAVNDTIGKVQKTISADVVKGSKMRMESFDQVVHLEVAFKKL